MVISSLPRYPQPEPSPAAIVPAYGRGWFLCLVLVTIIAFWVGVYLIRDKARAFSDAYRREEERAKAEEAKRGIMGLWQCTQRPSVELKLMNGRYSFRHSGGVEEGEYIWSGDRLKLVPERQPVWSFRCQLDGDELLLWNGRDRDEFSDFSLLRRVLEKSVALEVHAKEKVLQFWRVGK